MAAEHDFSGPGVVSVTYGFAGAEHPVFSANRLVPLESKGSLTDEYP
jgi:hypothetical protein